MDYVFKEILERYGLSGLIIGFLIWKHYIDPTIRRKRGTYKSYSVLDSEIKELNKNVMEHLQKESHRDIKFAVMETTLKHLSNDQIKMYENLESIFKMISKMKDTMIDMGYGGREK